MKKSMKKLPLWCGALLICCVLTFLGMPKEIRAADGTLNLNETKEHYNRGIWQKSLCIPGAKYRKLSSYHKKYQSKPVMRN